MPRPVSVQTSVSAAPPSGASPGSRAAYTKQLPQRDPLTKKPRVGPVELSRPPSEDESWGTWEAGGGARPEVATAHPAVAQQAQRSAAAASPTDMPVPLSPPPLPENESRGARKLRQPPRTAPPAVATRPPFTCGAAAAHPAVAPCIAQPPTEKLRRPPKPPLRSAAAASPTDTPVQREDPSPTSSAGGGALTPSECQRVLDLAHAATDPPEAATLAASGRKRARSAGRGRRDTSVPAASSSGASPGSRVPAPSREPAQVEAREEVQVEVHEDTRSCAAPLVTLSGGPCPNT
jgi:hypothetical protein